MKSVLLSKPTTKIPINFTRGSRVRLSITDLTYDLPERIRAESRALLHRMQAHKQIFNYKERMEKEGKGPFNEEQVAGASWFGPEGTDYERLCIARKRKRGGTALAQRGGKGSHE